MGGCIGRVKFTKSKTSNYQLNYQIWAHEFLHVGKHTMGMTSYDVIRLNRWFKVKLKVKYLVKTSKNAQKN